MLEAASCSTLRLAENPTVDCAALHRLKTLLHNRVLQDRHLFVGGTDADPHESTSPHAVGIVPSPARNHQLAQAAAGMSAKNDDIAYEIAARTLGKPASSRRGEGG
jgi:hypothetical protein